MNKRKKHEIIVGFVTILGIALLTISIIWGKNYSTTIEYQNVKMKFNSVNSLKKGDKIYVKGVIVGEIISVELKSNNVIVQGKIESAITVYSNATAIIVNKELMGGRIVIFKPGHKSVSSDIYNKNEFLIGNSSKGLTETLAELGDITGDLKGLFSKSDSLITSLTHILPKKNLGETIDELSSSLNKTISTINGDISILSKDFKYTLSKVNVIIDSVSTIANSGKEGIEDFQTMVKKISNLTNKLDSFVFTANIKLQEITDSSKSSLGKFTGSTEFYDGLQHTINNIDSLVNQIKKDGIKTNIDFW